jgi:murein L,D-transpeptidase YafK
MFFRRKNKKLSRIENPRIVIEKHARRLILYDAERLIKTYKIALGFEPSGDKKLEGDGRTPEGEFYVAVKNPKSKYFLSLGLSYPTPKHASDGLRDELISPGEYSEILKAHGEMHLPNQKTRLGGEIYIHGGGTLWDWTEGCAALDDESMGEVFAAVKIGSKVCINA